jgi:hypothetical protein
MICRTPTSGEAEEAVEEIEDLYKDGAGNINVNGFCLRDWQNMDGLNHRELMGSGLNEVEIPFQGNPLRSDPRKTLLHN